MINKNILSALLIIFIPFAALAQTLTPVKLDPRADFSFGWLHLRGELVTATCVITTKTKDMLIDLSPPSPAVNADNSSSAKPFTVYVEDCGTDVSDSIGIKFLGKPVPFEPDVLETIPVITPVHSPESGVALFYDKNKSILINGQPIELTYLTPLSQQIKMTANVVSLAQQRPLSDMLSFVTLQLMYP